MSDLGDKLFLARLSRYAGLNKHENIPLLPRLPILF